MRMKRTPLDAWIEETCNRDRENARGFEQWQMEQLNRVIAYAKKASPYYRETLSQVRSVTTWQEMGHIPLMDSTHLIKYGTKMLCVPQGEISRVVTLTTSGTTDSPKRLFFTEKDQELTVDFFHHGMKTLMSRGETAMVALPYKTPGSVGDLLAKALAREAVSPVLCGLMEDLQKAAKLLSERQAQVLIGVPTQVLALCFYCREHQITNSVKRILLSTDYAPQSLIRRVEAEWGCRIFNHYGMTETGLGAAVECEAHEGMHIRENDLYFEVVDPDSGEILPFGTEGELVFTTLTREGMPLIRYRTGDYGTLLNQMCACKSTLKRLKVGGRIHEKQAEGYTIQQMDEAVFSVDKIVNYVWKDETQVLHVYYMGPNAVKAEEELRKLPFLQNKNHVRIEMERVEEMLPYEGKRQIR